MPGPNPPICVYCKKRLAQYFEITRYNTNRENKGSVCVCSLLCMINWAYAYGATRAASAFRGAKDLFNRIGDALRGPQA